MDVGDKWRLKSFFKQKLFYVLQVFSFFDSLCRHPDKIGPCLNYPDTLCNRSFSIHSIGVCHRLYPDRRITAKCNIADKDRRGAVWERCGQFIFNLFTIFLFESLTFLVPLPGEPAPLRRGVRGGFMFLN